jgi:hypothetical protein
MPIEARVVGLPGALVAVLLVVAMLLYLGGVAPFAPAERMTLPEAAALESDADIVRQPGCGGRGFARCTR